MRLRRFRKLRRNRNYATMVLVAFVGILSVMGIGYSYLQQRLTMDISLSKKNNITRDYLAYIIASKNVNGNAEGLYTDEHGDIRYRGSDSQVKNYVTFNDEMWRIVGIFDGGYIKLYKEDSIGSYNWNDNRNNSWSSSSLYTYLNNTYYNTFSEQAQEQISSHMYYLSPVANASRSYSDMYDDERYSGTSRSIIQSIGLLYPSDYGYSSNISCSRDLDEFSSSSDCNENGNWLFSSDGMWFQTSISINNYQAFASSTTGDLTRLATNIENSVHPVVYLQLNVVWNGGTGTETDPYKIYDTLGPLTTDPINNPMNPQTTATTTGTGTGTGGTTAPTTGTGTGTPTTGTPTTGTPTTTGPTTGTPPGTTTPTGTVTPTTTTPIMTTSNSPVTTPNY